MRARGLGRLALMVLVVLGAGACRVRTDVGVQVNDRLSVEASWVHMSHAQLFGRQNPGIDNVGVRLNLGF